MREKLIELLNEAEEWADHRCDELECETCPADKMKSNCVQQLMVDRLIANGVRLEEKQATSDETSKWIPVTERLPDKNDDVLCSRGNHIGALMDVYTYMGDDKWDDTYGNRCYTEDEGITHWMPLPEPPKGE